MDGNDYGCWEEVVRGLHLPWRRVYHGDNIRSGNSYILFRPRTSSCSCSRLEESGQRLDEAKIRNPDRHRMFPLTIPGSAHQLVEHSPHLVGGRHREESSEVVWDKSGTRGGVLWKIIVKHLKLHATL